MKKILSTMLVVLVITIVSIGLFTVSASTENSGFYTITYHLDGGTNALKNPDVYTEDDVITLMDATKVGYDFVGWFIDSNMTEKISVISNRTGDLNVYAKFIPKSYAANFNDVVTLTLKAVGYDDRVIYLNYGETIDPYSEEIMGLYLSNNQNKTFSSSDPNFSGWFYNSAYTDRVSDSIDLTTNKTLYCHFKNTASGNPMFDGNTSVRYSGTTDVEKTYRVPTLSNGKLTIDFEIGYTYSDEIGIHTCSASYQIYVNGTIVHGKSWPYSFRGPRKDSITIDVNPGDLISCTTRSDADLEDWDAYRIIEYSTQRESVSINSTKSTQSTVLFDDTVANPIPNDRNGYDFLGWYDSQGNVITDSWKYTADQTFYPKWKLIKYDITCNLNGGTIDLGNPSSYTVEDTITLKNPTKPGYTFVGWYLDECFKNPISKIANQTGNITLYAKWKGNSYNLTVNANEGTFSPKVTFISDGVEIEKCYLYEQDTITAYRPDNKEGYIFAGWYKDASLTELFKFNGTVTDDVNLYAKWVECSENVINVESIDSFETTVDGRTEQLYAFVPLTDGKIVVSSLSDGLDLYGILYDSTKNKLIESDDISDDNLDFSYTYNVEAGQHYYIAVKGTTVSTFGEATINVEWTGDCTITGTTYPKRRTTIVYDTNYTLPEKPTREGYIFLGWFDENDTQITDGTWNFVTDKTLNAKWEETTYHTIVFKDIDGNIISSETYYLSEDIIAPTLPKKAPDNTYIYHAKWDNDYTGVCIGDAVYSPTFDAEYIEYTVVFVDEDGTELSRGTYHWGDVVTAPAAPTKDTDANYANTYTFAGWDNPVINCAGDTTYTATYTAVPLKQLVVTSLPEKVRYCIGESLDLTGLTLQLVYENGTIIPLNSVDAQFVSANISTSGRKTATITIAGVSEEFEIYVHDVGNLVVNVDSYLYPQSSHNYSNNLNETKTFTYPGAVSLVITFNSQTSVENNYDYIYIYDGAGNQIAKYTGTTAANKTLTITGDTFKVKLTSDSSQVKYGYAFSKIQANIKNADEIIHQPVIDPATVTCTQGGLTEGSHCEICGDILVAQEEVAALGHQYKTVFTWSEDHTSCTVTITCERGCGLYESVECVVTHNEPHQAQTVHTAVAEFDGARFTDVLTCDNFLVVFKDWDGTQISSTYYRAGDTVIVPANPTRAADKTYTYTFKGWNKAVVNCVSDATYTATYNSTYIDYTVTFKNWNGDVLSTKTYHYGDKVTAPNNTTKEANETYTYTFAGWDKAVVNCGGNTTYTATYNPIYIDYTVIFKNWDGTILSTKTYHYGDVVTVPKTPTKDADVVYTYEFAGWDKEVVNCDGNTTYTATYNSNYIYYTVTFKNWDGTVLATNIYRYGDKVTSPAPSTKEKDEYYIYTFAGWDNEVMPCAGNTEYTAIFKAEHYHTYNTSVIDPTCTNKGYTKNTCVCGNTYNDKYVNSLGHKYNNSCDTTCNVCGEKRTITHIYETTTTKATLTKNGSIVKKCSICGYVASTTPIKYVKSFALTTTNYTYTGAIRTPGVIVKDSAGKTLVKNTDYTVSYSSGRKNIGTYKVTVTMKGNYTGTKALYFKINPISYSKCKFALTTTNYTYNGALRTPGVTIKYGSLTLKKNVDYTVAYASGRKNVGTYKVTVKMKGKYSGTKTLTFKINPPKTTVSKLTAGKKSITVAISKKSSQVTGYQVQYSTSKSFSKATTKTISSYKTTKYTLKSLSAKKTYYVRVRTYKTVGKTKYYSGWSTYKYVKTK